jgi:hypothetical protein
MDQVLDLLGFAACGRSDSQLRGPCPLHGSTSGRSRSFSANPARNAYRCIKVGSAGNQLDLWAAANNMTVYDAALDLCKRLGVEVPWIREW